MTITGLMAAADIETRTGVQVEVAIQTNMQDRLKIIGVDMTTRDHHLLLSQNDLGLQVIQAGGIRVRLTKATPTMAVQVAVVIKVPESRVQTRMEGDLMAQRLALQLSLESKAGSWEKWMKMIEFLWFLGHAR